MRIKKLLPIIIICTMMVLELCSCSKGPSSVTLLIYMCGSDLESQTGIASENLQELMSSDIPDNVRIIVQTGGANKWISNNIPSDKIMRYEVKKGELQELSRLDDANMGDGSTLEDFVRWGAKALEEALKTATLCAKKGEAKSNATGLSVYYPSHFYMDEVKEYINICPSENYKKILTSIYSNIPETTISFKDAGYIGDDGKFHVSLTPESARLYEMVPLRPLDLHI